MRSINIDSFDPGYVNPVRPKRGKKMEPWMQRGGYVFLTGYAGKVGIKPEKMRDWRRLERRTSELFGMWQDVSRQFWNLAQSFPRPDDKSKSSYYDLIVDVGDDTLLKFSGDGYSIGSTSTMAEDLVGGKDYGKFTFLMRDEGGAQLGKLYRRMERLLRAHGKYKTALQRAVSDRLRKFREGQTSGAGYRYHEPAIFIIENDGRSYVVTSGTDGGLTWHDGVVYTTAATG